MLGDLVVLVRQNRRAYPQLPFRDGPRSLREVAVAVRREHLSPPQVSCLNGVRGRIADDIAGFAQRSRFLKKKAGIWRQDVPVPGVLVEKEH